MKKHLLLVIIALLTFSLAFGQANQLRRYRLNYSKVYKEGKLVSSSPNNAEFIFDESAKRIELKVGGGYQNRIFKISSKGIDPVNKDCMIYTTQMPTDDDGRLAVVTIVVNKFYKSIKFGSYTGNENGLRNYVEYQYE